MTVSVTDLRRSNRLARRRYAGSGGTWLWIGCASGHGGGLLVKGWERRKSAKQMRTFGTTARELRDKFYRLKARRGYKRAAVAIAHKILVAIYHMLSQQVSYDDLGDLYLDKINKKHLKRNLVHRLECLGYAVTLTLQPEAASPC